MGEKIKIKLLRPLKAIREKCVQCSGDNNQEVRHCPVTSCPLHKFRHGTRPTNGYDKSPLKTIREKCLMDCGEENSYSDVKNCTCYDCPLWPHRFGKRVYK